MPKYLIERDIPGAGQLTVEELQAISSEMPCRRRNSISEIG